MVFPALFAVITLSCSSEVLLGLMLALLLRHEKESLVESDEKLSN